MKRNFLHFTQTFLRNSAQVIFTSIHTYIYLQCFGIERLYTTQCVLSSSEPVVAQYTCTRLDEEKA